MTNNDKQQAIAEISLAYISRGFRPYGKAKEIAGMLVQAKKMSDERIQFYQDRAELQKKRGQYWEFVSEIKYSEKKIMNASELEMPPLYTEKEAGRRKIEDQTADFLKRGGKIEPITSYSTVNEIKVILARSDITAGGKRAMVKKIRRKNTGLN